MLLHAKCILMPSSLPSFSSLFDLLPAINCCFPSSSLPPSFLLLLSYLFVAGVFNGENFHMWAVQTEAYLEALALWEVIDEDYEVLPLPVSPTLSQIRNHKDNKILNLKQIRVSLQ